MATKRVESSKQRLMERIGEGKKYLEKESHDINELARLKNTLEKKKAQFDKDIVVYESSENKRTKMSKRLQSTKRFKSTQTILWMI